MTNYSISQTNAEEDGLLSAQQLHSDNVSLTPSSTNFKILVMKNPSGIKEEIAEKENEEEIESMNGSKPKKK